MYYLDVLDTYSDVEFLVIVREGNNTVMPTAGEQGEGLTRTEVIDGLTRLGIQPTVLDDGEFPLFICLRDPVTMDVKETHVLMPCTYQAPKSKIQA